MPIIVNSPYSGLPVKVRDQDVSRALRDEEGRVFYAVPTSDGSGYYGSPTRQGSAKDEQRAADLTAKMTQSKTSGVEHSCQQLHDATGKRRRGLRHYVVMLIILAAIIAGVWYFFFRTPQGAGVGQLPQPPNDRLRFSETAPTTDDSAQPPATADLRQAPLPWVTTATGLRYRVDEQGHGDRRATAGRFVRIVYLAVDPEDQSMVGSSGVGTVGFVLWSGQVLRGWDEGIAGMREGEQRTFLIPPDLLVGDWPGREVDAKIDGPVEFQLALLEVLPGVTYTVTKPGGGRLALPGDAVEMQYVASLTGAEHPYDDSYERNAPLRFRIGRGQVIAGWELGIAGMVEGEKRRISIPSYLAYGSRGAGKLIPPDATLTIDAELVRIIPDDRSDHALSRATN